MGADFKVRILGMDKLFVKLNAIKNPDLVKAATVETGKRILEQMRTEPSNRRVNSFTGNRTKPRHTRTGALIDGWKQEVAKTAQGWASYIRNTVPYVIYVQVAATQAWFHRGIWGTDEDAVTKVSKEVEARYNAEITKALSK